MSNSLRNLTIVAVLIGLGSLAARADNFYSNEAAWASALSSSPTTINFEGIAPNGGLEYYGVGPGSSTNVGGVNFAVGPAGTETVFFLFGDGCCYGYTMSAISMQTESFDYPEDLLITPSASVTALGFDFGTLGGGNTATITLSDGSVQTVTDVVANPNFQFFGVTAPGGITSVDITVSGTAGLDLADFSYGTANGSSPVPEPGTMLLLGSGLLGLAGVVRRKIGQRA
jgi:hypothetical protein